MATRDINNPITRGVHDETAITQQLRVPKWAPVHIKFHNILIKLPRNRPHVVLLLETKHLRWNQKEP